MVHLFEALMLVCFGLSWPFNIAKSIRSKTARGKSIQFEILIITGYVCGLIGKLLSGDMSYVLYFYVADILMVSIDLVLTIGNTKRDKEQDRLAASGSLPKS